jgi:hypothetical protein
MKVRYNVRKNIVKGGILRGWQAPKTVPNKLTITNAYLNGHEST